MKHNRITKIFLTLITTISLFGCDSSSKWEMTKEDYSNADRVQMTLTYESGNKQYLVANYEPFVKESLSKDDIVLFDIVNALEKLNSDDYDYEFLNYQTIKEFEVSVTNITTDEDYTRFTITVPEETTNNVAVFVNKDKSVSGNYVIGSYYELYTMENDGSGKTAQEEFEERYGRSDKSSISPVLSNVLSGLTGVIIGAALTDPSLVACGFMNMINGIVGGICSIGEPSIRDVMEKLYEIEHRITDLDKKMTENFNQLRRDEKLTQSYVNQVLLQQYQTNIDTFETTFMKDIKERNNTFADLTQKNLRDITKSSKTIEIPYYYNDQSVFSYRVLTEVNAHQDDKKITINVNDFTNAKAKLIETNNIFTSDVMTEFRKDIYNATEGISLPTGATRDLIADYAVGRLVQEFTKEYYSAHESEAMKYVNQVISLSDRFNGETGQSILVGYENRFKYMYNFGSEMKKSYSTVSAQLRNFLDVNFAAALEACLWSQSNYETLLKHYSSAIDSIKASCDNVAAISDNYSFILNHNVTASLFASDYESYFSSKGNHPTHYSKFHLYRYNGSKITDYEEIDINNYNPVVKDDHYSLALRMNNLKEINAISSNLTYYEYLTNANILAQYNIEAIKEGINDKSITNDPYRFATTIAKRSLTNDDKGKINCYFTDKGSDKMKYFTVGNWYTYKNGHSSGDWHATCYETDYVSAKTGDPLTDDKMVGLEGCYSEGHWYWRTDERFRFNDGPGHRYFFSLTYDA